MRLLSIVLRMIVGLMCTAILMSAPNAKAATLNGHNVLLDSSSNIIPWTTYDQVLYQAWDYLLHRVPNDSQTGKPAYFSRSYLFPDTQLPADWPHNPAGLYGMLTESALKYYGYSGNIEVVNLALNVATAQLNNGMTPNDISWKWPGVPYASGDSGSLIYHGAAYGDSTGRGDGTGVIEPDKVGEMGNAWLELYRFNGNTLFRDAAIAAADALVSNVRTSLDGISEIKSPWPFRVYAQTGVVREEYCANVIAPIRLFDGLIALGLDSVDKKYQPTRQIAWDWLMAYPMQNNVWANYFEDIWMMPDTSNTNQYNAMMTARYLLEHPDADPQWNVHVPGLISWVETNFGEPAYGANTIAEQMQFHFPMGSHTSRYASVNALLYEKTGDTTAKEKAYRALNWSTYMARPEGVVTNSTGVVIDGPLVNTQWFTDGYGDYIRHFMTSFGAVPEWAPAENRLLRSSSIIKSVNYLQNEISYTTSESASTEVLRTTFTPAGVTVDGEPLSQRADLSLPGWTFDPSLNVLRVRHDTGSIIQIVSGTLVSIALAPVNQTILTGTTLQYTATGSYSDGSTQNITSQTTWASSDPAVATVNSAGLASGLSPGSSTISATLGGISDSTTVTVQVAPLTITTSSLPAGTMNLAYSATLAASGGTPPYTWSIVAGSGAMPGGLTLSSGGIISGTPTSGGVFNFSIQASDGQQTASRPFSISITAQADFSVWPTTLPVIGDSGPDSAVELGVKFRSDTAGFITGVRFYKAGTNTGTHIGNLWSSTGTRLATATFTGETSSGWQQVNFTTPVAITANTVYIASYHTNTGHYSCDQYFFASTGVDRPPLHALAEGVSGVNGVYAYGTNSSFPRLGWRSSNYWVDVVLRTTLPPPVTLQSIAVTPANQTILTGATRQFTATGSYSDGSTQNLTTQTTWSSSNPAVATVNSGGLASGLSPGSSTITATLGGISGSTTLTVQVVPLTITTASLPGGTLNTPYSATLAASGGTPPYTWSIVTGTGTLPGGLTLSSGGIISGTPTSGGTTSSFTVQVADSGNPKLNTVKNLSITVTVPITLQSITVTPADQTILAGTTRQYTATGSYSDSTTQNITSQATWASSSPAVATVNSGGLASALTPGSSTISATLGGISGGTTVTVQVVPLTITTSSLPAGTTGLAYSATLAASGGTPPYTWSIVAGSGALPGGLILSSGGIISGTPTSGGTFNFSIQASDGQRTASKPFSISIVAQASFTVWPSTLPAVRDSGPDSAVELGVKFRSDTAGFITGIRFYKARANNGTHIGNLWSSTGTRLATATFTGETSSGWQQVNFTTPVAITANTVYIASYHTNAGHYSCDQYFFATSGVDRPPLHALAEGISGVNGVYAYGTNSSFPSLGWRSSNYWVDVVLKTTVTTP